MVLPVQPVGEQDAADQRRARDRTHLEGPSGAPFPLRGEEA